jgi:hypothetical protein
LEIEAKGANALNQKIFEKTTGFPELTHATKMSLISAGKTDAAKTFQ